MRLELDAVDKVQCVQTIQLMTEALLPQSFDKQ